jgi:hypothetical protein
MEAVCPSETLVPSYKSIHRYTPEDQHQCPHSCENLKSHLAIVSVISVSLVILIHSYSYIKLERKLKQLTKNIYKFVNLTEFPRVDVFRTWVFVASEHKVQLPPAGTAAASQQPPAAAADSPATPSASEVVGETDALPVKRKREAAKANQPSKAGPSARRPLQKKN